MSSDDFIISVSALVCEPRVQYQKRWSRDFSRNAIKLSTGYGVGVQNFNQEYQAELCYKASLGTPGWVNSTYRDNIHIISIHSYCQILCLNIFVE